MKNEKELKEIYKRINELKFKFIKDLENLKQDLYKILK